MVPSKFQYLTFVNPSCLQTYIQAGPTDLWYVEHLPSALGAACL